MTYLYVLFGEETNVFGRTENSPNGGDQWVRLENGRVLILEKERVEMPRFLDWLFGKRANR